MISRFSWSNFTVPFSHCAQRKKTLHYGSLPRCGKYVHFLQVFDYEEAEVSILEMILKAKRPRYCRGRKDQFYIMGFWKTFHKFENAVVTPNFDSLAFFSAVMRFFSYLERRAAGMKTSTQPWFKRNMERFCEREAPMWMCPTKFEFLSRLSISTKISSLCWHLART